MMPIPPITDMYRLPFAEPVFGAPFALVDHLHPFGHRGTDFVADEGAPIASIANGLVVLTQWSEFLGRVTVIATRLRQQHEGSRTLFVGYAHQSARTVKVGQTVKRGQKIGAVGGAIVDGKPTSGSASTGSHLHLTCSFESATAVFAGATFDPLPFIRAHDHQ